MNALTELLSRKNDLTKLSINKVKLPLKTGFIIYLIIYFQIANFPKQIFSKRARHRFVS